MAVLPGLLASLAQAEVAATGRRAHQRRVLGPRHRVGGGRPPPRAAEQMSSARSVPSGPVVLHASRTAPASPPFGVPDDRPAPPLTAVAPIRPDVPPTAPEPRAADPFGSRGEAAVHPVGFTASAERGAPRQRLLVAGLTVLTDDTTQVPPTSP